LLAIYVIAAVPVGTVLYLTACLLPPRWLGHYALVAGLGLVFYSDDNRRDPEVGLGMLVVYLVAVFGAAAAVAGIIARLAIAGMRMHGIRRRYAWLPAPILFIGLLIAPFFWGWHLLDP
jgi:hypothetical protein